MGFRKTGGPATLALRSRRLDPAACSPPPAPLLGRPASHAFSIPSPPGRNGAELCGRHHLWSEVPLRHALSGAGQAAHHHLSDRTVPGSRHHLHVSNTHGLVIPYPEHPWVFGWFFLASRVPSEAWENVWSLSSLVLMSIIRNLLGTGRGRLKRDNMVLSFKESFEEGT